MQSDSVRLEREGEVRVRVVMIVNHVAFLTYSITCFHTSHTIMHIIHNVSFA